MYVSSLPENAQFDYVIVGAGSSGCALANRLSADGRHQVLLIEAGGRDNHIKIHVPMFVARDADGRARHVAVQDRAANPSQRQAAAVGARTGDRRLELDQRQSIRARRSRGIRQVARAGCEGWGYSDMLPLFKRLEDYPEGDPAVRGRAAQSASRGSKIRRRLSDAYVDACEEDGYGAVADYNDGSYEGTFNLQYSTRKGLRSSSAVGISETRAASRSNLTC